MLSEKGQTEAVGGAREPAAPVTVCAQRTRTGAVLEQEIARAAGWTSGVRADASEASAGAVCTATAEAEMLFALGPQEW
ncbi:hypothetical protein ACTI_30550 [Actinoplanes sp. OR16]|nr:hypothetical protein ACTI_30550 [Actinoplanes sp. OR16]